MLDKPICRHTVQRAALRHEVLIGTHRLSLSALVFMRKSTPERIKFRSGRKVFSDGERLGSFVAVGLAAKSLTTGSDGSME
jgi:hypothetical protein